MAEPEPTLREQILAATIDRGWVQVTTAQQHSLDRHEVEVVVHYRDEDSEFASDMVAIGTLHDIDGALGISDEAVYVDPSLLSPPSAVEVAAKALYDGSEPREGSWESLHPMVKAHYRRDAQLVVDALAVLDRHQVPTHVVQPQED